VILRSTYRRRPDARADSSWFGTFDLEVVAGADDAQLPAGTRLALWSAMLLEPTEASSVRVVERLAGHLVLEWHDTDAPVELPWTIAGLRSRFPARHANDGPETAWLVLPDGRTIDVDVEPSAAIDPPTDGEPSIPRTDAETALVAVVPHPAQVEIRSGERRRHRARLTSGPHDEVWSAIDALVRRAGHEVLDGTGDALAVTLGLDVSLEDEAYRLSVADGAATLMGGTAQALRHGLVTLAQLLIGDGVGDADISDEPRVPFRAVHLDLARRWYEPDVVERLIDVAAWRKLSHVHLHLTDDEAWRFHVDAYPALATIGGTRRHGRPLPPMCGSGPAPYGRAYTDDEIAHWVERADRLGITLVPEVDVPAHCHAALVAVPELRDPDDTSTAVSVQGYPNNVLVPGLTTTMPFLDAVFTTLSKLFPNSPVLHIGGDEVPTGAWGGSPAAQAYATERGLATTSEIETAFHRDVIGMIASATRRTVGMWEEAALGGVEPSAYAVAWTSPEAGRRLSEAGHRVVMAPGQAYYLDMAPGRSWELPGGSWAGNVTLADTCAYDPFAGWNDSDGANGDDRTGPYGIQACVWGEHIADLDVLDALVFPRLDAVAERAWTGRVVGGPDSIAARAAGLPRFTT
jgi:hexosaminidase